MARFGRFLDADFLKLLVHSGDAGPNLFPLIQQVRDFGTRVLGARKLCFEILNLVTQAKVVLDRL